MSPEEQTNSLNTRDEVNNLSEADLDSIEAEVMGDTELSASEPTASDELPKAEMQDDDKPVEPTVADQLIKNKNKTVPYGALHEERQLRKAAQADLLAKNAAIAEYNTKIQKMEEAFKQLQTKASEIVEKAPDFNEDPIGALKFQQDQLLKQQQDAQRKELLQQEQQSAQQAQQAQLNNFLAQYQTSMKEYTEVQPDIMQAYDYLINTRLEELKEIGYSAQDALHLAQQEELMVTSQAFRSDKNPGEVIYNLASRRGYTTPKVTPEVDFAKINTLKTGIKASKGLTSSSQQASNPSSLEDLMERLGDLKDKEADAFWDKFIKGKL